MLSIRSLKFAAESLLISVPRRQANSGRVESRRPGFNEVSPRSYEPNRSGGSAAGRHASRRRSARWPKPLSSRGIIASIPRPSGPISSAATPTKPIKKLYSTGYFSDVQVSHRGSELVVRVVENSTVINHVVFVGNSKVKSEELQKEIQLEGPRRLQPGGRRRRRSAHSRYLPPLRPCNAATVTERTVQTPNSTVDVVFDINEGDKTGVKEIRFVGNHVYSDVKLKGLMETTEMNYLSFFKTSDVYRSRSSGEGRRGDPALLPQERLCRFPRHRRRPGL